MTVKEAKQACAIYVRRSHRDAEGSEEDQRRGGKSLAQQEKECRALAKRQGLNVVEVYREAEGSSASKFSRKSRPEYLRALKDLDAGDRFRSLLVYDLDRLERGGWAALADVFESHAETGARRILDTTGADSSNPDQHLLLVIKMEINAEYSRKLSRAVKRGKSGQRDDGVWLGGRAPYGLRVVGQKLAHDPETYPTARRIADMALADIAFRQIAITLNTERVPNTRGKKGWNAATIRSMLLSPGFAGVQSIRGKNSAGNAKTMADIYLNPDGDPVPIGDGVITLAERRKIEALMKARTKPHSGKFEDKVVGSRTSNSLIGRLGRCSMCDGPLTMSGRSDAHIYQCVARTRGKPCRGSSIRVAIADEAIGELFKDRILDPYQSPGLIHLFADRWVAHDSPELEQAREDAEQELRDARENLERVEDAFADGLLDADALKRQRPRMVKRLERAEAALRAATPDEPDYESFDMDEVAAEWDNTDLPRRRELLSFAAESVVLKPAKARGSKQGAKGRINVHWLDGSWSSY